MSIARKCDVCKRLFEEDKNKLRDGLTVGKLNHANVWECNICLDLCPRCDEAIKFKLEDLGYKEG